MAKVRRSSRIAVMLHHGLGDVVCGLPLLYALDRSLPPDSKLAVLVKSPLERSLINLCAWSRPIEIIELGAERGYRAAVRMAGHALRLRAWRPDVLLAAHAADSRGAVLFARLAGGRQNVGPEGRWSHWAYDVQTPTTENEHKVVYFTRFARLAGLLSVEAEDLAYPPLQMARPRPSPGRAPIMVCMAPGSGEVERHKRWPPERYSELCRRLSVPEGRFRLVLMGSPAEAGLLETIRSQAHGEVEARVVRGLDESFAILAESDFVISACSGSAHLAALAQVPQIALHGPTNPRRTGPYSSMLHVIRRGYACSPCYRPGFLTGCGNPVCMSDISAQDVARALSGMIDGEKQPELPELSTTWAIKPDPVVVNPLLCQQSPEPA